MTLSKPIKWQIYRENTTHCGSYMLLFTMISFFHSSQLISKNLSNNEDFNLPPKFVINFEKPELHWHYLSSAFWVNRSIWWNCSYSGNYYYSKRFDWCAQLLKIFIVYFYCLFLQHNKWYTTCTRTTVWVFKMYMSLKTNWKKM